MSEEKLQSDIVRKFSELYPLKRGQLFHVPNERITASQKLKAKSIGVFSGVSDLIYIGSERCKCLEIKAPGSHHKVIHVRQQLEWGKTMESIGNDWKIITDANDAIAFINNYYNEGLSIDDVEKMLNEAESKGKKTIKF